MVFLGGAVLANIVSGSKVPFARIYLRTADGRQGRYVDIKARMGGARIKGIGEAGCKIMLAGSTPTTTISIQFQHRATMLGPHEPHIVSFSRVPCCV